MQIFGIKSCDSCRKAVKALNGAEFVDIRAQALPDAIKTQAMATFGPALLNTRSTTWRGLDEAERARPAGELLADYPTLMKRPLIEDEGRLYLGWGRDTQAALGVI